MKYSNIGGQAVMEGVMMRNAEKWAVAVRTADRQITVKTGEYRGVIPWKGVNKIPILRGVCSFIDSLYLGMKTLMFSADLFAEESEKELEERLADEKKKAEKLAREKAFCMEGMAAETGDMLREQGLSTAEGDDLEKHAYAVNEGIEDGEIRNLHILAAV